MNDNDLSSIVGILAGLGVGITSLAAVAAASTATEIWVLLIIFF